MIKRRMFEMWVESITFEQWQDMNIDTRNHLLDTYDYNPKIEQAIARAEADR